MVADLVHEQQPLVLRQGVPVGAKRLCEPADARQRRAQLVGHRRHQVAAQVKHLLELCDERPLELETAQVPECDPRVASQRQCEATLLWIEASEFTGEHGEHTEWCLVGGGDGHEQAALALHGLVRRSQQLASFSQHAISVAQVRPGRRLLHEPGLGKNEKGAAIGAQQAACPLNHLGEHLGTG